MIKLGILGGMSYESTTHYYDKINSNVNKKLGKNHCANIRMISDDFQRLVDLMDKNDWQSIREILTNNAKQLKSIQAEKLVIATNTMHKLANEISEDAELPIIHIADSTAKKIKESKITRVGLIGTKPTMVESFLKERLSSHGLDIITPQKQNHIDTIHRIIFEELCNGNFDDEDCKNSYKTVINWLRTKEKIEGIILGCTEIGMLIKQDDISIPIFDSAECHIEDISNVVVADELCEDIDRQKLIKKIGFVPCNKK